MLLAATVVLFLMMSMPAYQTRRILYREEQNFMTKNQLLGPVLQGQVPPISEPNPPTTTDTPHSRISPKTFASDHTDVSSSLDGVQSPPHVQAPPSGPNPCTHIPSRTVSYNTLCHQAPLNTSTYVHTYILYFVHYNMYVCVQTVSLPIYYSR